MPPEKRRSARTRRPRELDAAIGMTVIWASIAYFFVVGGGFSGRQSPVFVLIVGAVVVALWWWAIHTIKARNAAGKTLDQLQSLTPDQFEEWVAARFRDLGYSVKVTGLSGDHGADLLAEKQGEVAVVQCKNYKAWSVGEPVLRDLYGTMHDFKATKAYLVTTGKLTKAADDWAKGKPIEVWDGDKIVGLSTSVAQEKADGLSGEPAKEVTAMAPVTGPTITKTDTARICPRCGSALVERRNRSTGDAFLGCSRYPECRHTQPLVPALDR